MILINCTDKFCYRHVNFQIAEAATEGALKIQIKVSQNSYSKHLCQGLFFNKVTGLRSATLLKRRLRHRRFPGNFVKFSMTPFWKATVSQNMKAYI